MYLLEHFYYCLFLFDCWHVESSTTSIPVLLHSRSLYICTDHIYYLHKWVWLRYANLYNKKWLRFTHSPTDPTDLVKWLEASRVAPHQQKAKTRTKRTKSGRGRGEPASSSYDICSDYFHHCFFFRWSSLPRNYMNALTITKRIIIIVIIIIIMHTALTVFRLRVA